MVFLAIFIAFIILIIITIFSKLSFIIGISIDSKGFNMEIKVMLYRILKLFSWNFKEGGLDFFLKKKKQVPKDKKKKKGRISAVLNLIFSKDTYNHLKKNMEVFILSVKGRLSTKNAALTALLYGNIWSVIGVLIPFIPQRNLVLDFYPDFQKETPDFHISCILRARIIHIIKLIANDYIDRIRKGENEKYGTASN
ncbi:MAG TPA: DUF2953 domain-containing protein [Clostridiaceae bacterium]|jgi:hypothetical protein|nr:DUF2953 domain-containing protein [Clostridiaceae bacterium]